MTVEAVRAARTLPDQLDALADSAPEREFLVYGGERWTYRAFRDEARRLAAGLAAQGVRRGDHVGLLMGNCAEWLLVLFAALSLGARAVAVNTWFRTHELRHVLASADIDLLVAADRYLGQDYPALLREAGAFRKVETVVILGETPPGALPFSALRREPGAFPGPAPDDVAQILFTSGTTAMPKGAQLTHRGILENMRAIGERMRLTPDDRVWLAINLFWSFAAANALGAALTHGAAIVLQHAFEPGEALALIERERCSVFYGMPNMARAMWEHPDRPSRDLSSLRTGLSIGTPGEMALIERLGVGRILQVYGLTEAYGNSAVCDYDDPVEVRHMTCGRPLPGQEVRLVDPETGLDGDRGEIWLRGRTMPGYYNDPERDAEIFTADGWMKTGDLAARDGGGRLVFRGRLKDMLKSGGINIAPREIEAFLQDRPGVAEAHVVGVPDPVKGEVPVAAVVAEPGASLDADALKRACRAELAAYKTPRRIHIVERAALPVTATGKVRKRELAERLARRALPGGEENDGAGRQVPPSRKSV